jgi:hypothetical protein
MLGIASRLQVQYLGVNFAASPTNSTGKEASVAHHVPQLFQKWWVAVEP